MKKNMYYFALCAVVLFTSLSSCKKKKDETKPTDNTSANEVTDNRDGNKYTSVTIGTQTWLTSSARYKTANSTNCANNDCNTYGVFYSYEEAKTACPAGYHLASDREWQILEFYVGMKASDTATIGYRGASENIGTKLKEGGSSGLNLKLQGTESGNQFGTGGQYWTSTINPSDNSTAYSRYVWSTDGSVSRANYVQIASVKACARCIKD